MKPSYRKRSFLNSTATSHTSYIDAVVESSGNGEYRWGSNILTIADSKRIIRLEFFLGRKQERRRSLKKINLLIDVLTRFRDALTKESELIDKAE